MLGLGLLTMIKRIKKRLFLLSKQTIAIDTEQAYSNERGVGVGIKTCGVPIEDPFITSKVAAEAKTYDTAAKSINETLDKMGLDYIDLMLIHSPQPWAVWQNDKRYFR